MEIRNYAEKKRAAEKPLVEDSGADNGVRTRDPHLGKVVLYQLSHVRKLNYQSQLGGDARIRTGVKALQASALPFGHVAKLACCF